MVGDDKLPDTSQGVLEEARHQALVENTAQTIFYEIQEIENNRVVNEQRWVWELLQNALDATPQGKQTQVRISWNGPELVFEHNGDAFAPDELAHLVYHGSTKYRDPMKRGKFGRGFLVTHLLSKNVHISGLERDPGGAFRFNVEIDRGGDADAIRQKMDFAWGQIEKSRVAVPTDNEQSSSYNTRYVYRPDNIGTQAVTAGIESARRCFPYVLALIPELDEVSLAEPSMELKWCKEDVRLDASDTSVRFTRVRLQKTPFLADTTLQPPDEHFTIIEKLGGSSESQPIATVALMLREHQAPEVVIDDLIPRFFVEGLPVVGTEQLPLPMVIHSAEFQVEAGRTGLHLEAAETPQQVRNWKLVSLVPNGYIALLAYGSCANWGSIHLLADIRECPSKNWLNSSEFAKTVVQPVVLQIFTNANIRLVKTIHGECISVKDAVIPRDDLGGELFDMLLTWKPAKHKLVEREVSGFWGAALSTMAKLLGRDVEELPACWSIERLASEVSCCSNLQSLGNNVDLKQDEDVADWLNKLISLIITSGRKSLLMDVPLLPNQKGTLCVQSALYRDPGVDEELKDIATAADIDERAKFLLRQISFPDGMLKDRTELEVLNTLLGKSNQLPPEQNARLLAWLTLRQQYHERVNSYPVFTLGSAQRMDKNHPLLKPLAKWPEGSAAFVELFPKDFVLAEAYQELADDCLTVLENLGFVYASLIYNRDEKDLEKLVPEVPGEEDWEEHEHRINVKVTDLVFLEEKGKGITDAIKGSKLRARKFVEFIFAFLLTSDRSWKQAVFVPCSCGKEHRVFACGWLRTLSEYQWVPLRGRGHGQPTAENVAAIIDESLFNKLTQDDDCAIFLQRLGIGVSDLFRVKITDPSERLRADRLAAKMYAQDSQMRALLSHVLDDADLRELAQKHLEQKRLTQRNREIGTRVEDLIKRALKAEHISVERTGIGSDYEVEYDFIENGQEQGLAVGKYLLEVKATSTDDVRMTLTQGSFAVSPPSKYVGYVLCVCPVTSGTVTELDVKNQARFVFDIGSAVKQALDNANNLQIMENNLRGAGDQGVQLEIGVSQKRLKVSPEAWLQGLDFANAVNRLKDQPV